jgi:5'-deoxy-5'-methylthioadenosine phosphorylase
VAAVQVVCLQKVTKLRRRYWLYNPIYMLAIIGGSGLTTLANLSVSRKVVATTAWGDPSSPITIGQIAGKSVMFLARHGPGHTIPPQKINYRANICALKDAGATKILAVAAVGGIGSACGPGRLVVPDQIIDYTSNRAATYFEGQDKQVVHIDFTWPYSQTLRDRVIEGARLASVAVVDGGVYGATNGPRLETAAEINRMERDGCTLVGMTGMPEAALAREQDVPYASLAVVANWAAGRGDSSQAISLEIIRETLDEAMEQARRVIEKMVQAL